MTICFIVGCDAASPIAYVLPSVDGTWTVQLQDVPGTLQIVVENGVITQYDQGGGELQPIEEMPPFTQDNGKVSFSFQATQAFTNINNGEPAEFIVEGEGDIQADGTVDATITFTSLDGLNEGGSTAVMSR